MRFKPLYAAIGAALVAPVGVATAQSENAEQLETITVVGSRIKRTDIETSQPVFVLEREDLQKTGLVSVGDVLQKLDGFPVDDAERPPDLSTAAEGRELTVGFTRDDIGLTVTRPIE